MTRVVVTGGAGFIGSNLVRRLVESGYETVVVDNLSTGRLENLRGLDSRYEFLRGSVCDREILRVAFRGAQVVFHQAALPSVQRSIEDPIACHDNNVHGTLAVLLTAQEMGVRRVVLASSSSVYGNSEALPKTEDMRPNPLSPYAVSKYAGELYARVFSSIYGLETVCLRYFNVFGPFQDPHSEYAAVIPKFITRMIRKQRPTIYGDGEQSRDFTYVDNVVEANLLAATAEGVSGEVFNVGCGTRYSLNQLVDALNRMLGSTLAPEYEAQRPGDVRHSLASIEKAWVRLGYRPRVSFAEGLRRTVEWFTGLR